mmetsp:Transcript_7593/g.23458  ORF Transcript_7593/g.23458 Transcript_7593/m.23458 type:complete len:280 (-) Transcript_7593:337-1176(-)
MKTSGRWPVRPRTWPTRRSALVRVGSMCVPTPMRPPGTAYWRGLNSAYKEQTREQIGVTDTWPFVSFLTMPGRTSISSPTHRTPCRMEPPATPPCKSSTSWPGLLTSNDRITMSLGLDVKSRFGTGIAYVRYSQTQSMLYLSTALTGMMGAASATVPATNFRICSCCASACSGLTKSTLFCKMMMFCSRMISTAAKCSEVCGCGHASLPATRRSAASMTAAPFSMVAIRMSWPGQSTKETCRTSSHVTSFLSVNTSGVDDPFDVKLPPGPAASVGSERR